MSEAATKADIRLALGREPGLRLFNNPVGNGWMGKLVAETKSTVTLAAPRRVAFGLLPGSSDLIGFRSVTITPDMVGQKVAIFAALEIKVPGGHHPVTDDQRRFIAAIEAAGGIAGVARSPEQARIALGLPQPVLV